MTAKAVCYVLPKGDGKSQVSLQHTKLASAREAARIKKHWTNALKGLEEALAS